MQLTLGSRGRVRRADLSALLNAAIRALGLAARFGLVIYIARHMGAADLGRFGLIAGGVAMAPAVLGWGLNYHVGRSLIGAARADVVGLLGTRLSVTLLSAGLAAGAFVALNGYFQWLSARMSLLVALVLVLECVGLDVQMALINLGRNTLANVLLFIRTSAWAFVFCAVALLQTTWQSLDTLMVAWCAGQLCAVLVAFHSIRSWGQGCGFAFRWAEIGAAARRSKLVYLSDISQVSVLYADRFVVGLFVTVEALGRYTLLWSIANAVFVLVQSAVLLPSLRRLVLALGGHGPAGWWRGLKAELARGLVLAVAIAVPVYGFATLGLPRVLTAEFHAGVLLIALLLANVLKVGSDALGYGLYSLGEDRPHMLLNMAGAALALLLASIGTSSFGIDGAGWAACVAVLLLAAARAVTARRAYVKRIRREVGT